MNQQFKNASLVSMVNDSIVVKSAAGIEHTFTNASIVSVNNDTIIIESEWEPKKGELIKVEHNGKKLYVIVKTIKDFILRDYGFFNGYRISATFCGWDIKNINISPVTPEEQKEFDNICKAYGQIWNNEKLKWEIYKWKPSHGETFFTVVTNYLGIYITDAVWTNCETDQSAYNCGNCFRTKKEAQKVVDKIRNIFKD